MFAYWRACVNALCIKEYEIGSGDDRHSELIDPCPASHSVLCIKITIHNAFTLKLT